MVKRAKRNAKKSDDDYVYGDAVELAAVQAIQDGRYSKCVAGAESP